MIELHTWATPNGRKVSIMLEECGLPYTVHPIDISKGEQFKPEFLKIAPTTAFRPSSTATTASIALFESGAILIYLAEKTGKLLPKDPAKDVRDARVADVADGRRRVRCSARSTTS